MENNKNLPLGGIIMEKQKAAALKAYIKKQMKPVIAGIMEDYSEIDTPISVSCDVCNDGNINGIVTNCTVVNLKVVIGGDCCNEGQEYPIGVFGVSSESDFNDMMANKQFINQLKQTLDIILSGLNTDTTLWSNQD